MGNRVIFPVPVNSHIIIRYHQFNKKRVKKQQASQVVEQANITGEELFPLSTEDPVGEND